MSCSPTCGYWSADRMYCCLGGTLGPGGAAETPETTRARRRASRIRRTRALLRARRTLLTAAIEGPGSPPGWSTRTNDQGSVRHSDDLDYAAAEIEAEIRRGPPLFPAWLRARISRLRDARYRRNMEEADRAWRAATR